MAVVITDAWRSRFGGTARLYGEAALQLFADAHVCVVGIGGVGSWAAEALARTGIGAITLIDMDDVCVTNTNRQIHALRDTVGQAKSEVMAERIRQINPECRITVVDDFVTVDNVAQYMNAGFSYVIDAIDSVRPKAAMIAYCRRNKIPLVTTGGAGGQTDPTQIQVVDLAKTIQDPLAAKLRERLKSDFGVVKNSKGKLGVDCVFSTEALVYPQADGSVCAMKSTAEGPKRMDCASGFGAATMVTATFGFVAVSHALKKMMAKAARSAV
ncbi:tRNA cyclic N6-threonylcarbamoyladenosine(37) synthase TcdA [Cronobacter sakazakii]|uniref:tRNA cyclic N6-threonylcarbamoyladenosine(37) synthase TcdA n=1 Tax=Cronobacter sakazakii TaxID=28141 RepID=UPI0006D1A060|nr:tRNA cyclic N6-threonylcarbamoyladenosine(37) synthase TcdA [Cronobacter sakazakii]EGT5760004.1 tRNA cyclic N6-threonylcarbamoyladenosine(37) synthase TcdA [Cronobacter sakazakii]EIX1612944.1 tRNA cyclic N6-threonylcarbamoyladenosine(37) synthase TcdA [Cronobacter sakazakii]EJG0759388.1 tRNA cyclic N6-threonylcarbamoyladenosine(37) synthase TcdA [Cronobacter sakazakii]ELY2490709.1 tRNA cyclic N6-threonylcarbamoyladenosine(37) synthase TcdA [Cronobacter sakazakii]ELY2616210.1 tRNA cyclic N6-